MPQWHWILTQNGKWHAWPVGGRRTQCGHINVEHLRENPAQSISRTVGPDALVCAVCARKTGHAAGVASSLDTCASAWAGRLRLHLTRVHIKASGQAIEEFARRLAEIGPPDSVEARAVFDEVRVLFLTPTHTRTTHRGKAATFKTLPHLKDAISKLPPTPKILTRLAATMRTYRAITRLDPAVDRFHAGRVIETMLQIEAPEAYIKHLNDRGLPHLASMFHPNTLERAKKDTALRGLFAGSTEYWDSTADQLNIVSD